MQSVPLAPPKENDSASPEKARTRNVHLVAVRCHEKFLMSALQGVFRGKGLESWFPEN